MLSRPLGQIVLPLAVAFLAVLVIGAGPAAARGGCSGSATPAFQLGDGEASKAALCLINRERASRGLKPLKADRRQEEAARSHNRVMLKKRCFDHQCAGERDLVGRLVQAGYLPCSCSWSVGENIAWGSGSESSPRNIVNAWMNSAPHRANILSKTFDEAGVSVMGGSPAGERDAATFTMDFGSKH